VRRVAPLLLKLCHGYCVHNEADRAALEEAYGLGDKPIRIIPHGPYDQYAGGDEDAPAEAGANGREPDVCELLYFGVIRPFKGVDDLLEAFAELDDEEVKRFRLTVVGETWEGFTKPVEMIAEHRHRDRITLVNRYVADEEVGAFFRAADAVVLPYHRSSASGPLHLAMSQGLPAVVTAVGGLVEAAGEYEGAIRIPPKDPAAIRAALDDAWRMRGQHFEDPHSWDRTLARFDQLFAETRPRRLAA
jgi:glycosyltransferase involved in cell wall biosynthesis